MSQKLIKLKQVIFLLLVLPLVAQAEVNIQRWTTSAGTQVLLVERHENPIVDMEISFKGAGSVFNPKDKSQVAEFTAALLTAGTKKLDEEQFNEKANDIAASISSDSGQENASISLRSLSERQSLKQAVELVNQSLVQPRFDTAVFSRLQRQSITALKQQEATPNFIAGRALMKLAYPNHPYGSSANMSEESLRKVTLSDIRAFHHTHYGLDNAVVAIVGDVNRNQAERLVQKALDGLPLHGGIKEGVPEVEKIKAERKDILFAGEQSQVLLGMPLIKRRDADYYALVAGNYILGGGGFDSRLMKVLRDKKGYTYGVYSSLEPASEAGLFTVSYSTQKKNTKDSLVNTQAVIEQFIANGPTEAELKQAKANIIGSFPLRFDSNIKLLRYLSLIGVNNLPSSYLEDYPKAVEKLTTEQIKEAWQRRVKFSDLNIVVVGAE